MTLSSFIGYFPALVEGAINTVLLTIVSVFFGALLGLTLALCRLSKVSLAINFSRFYIWLFRGTPLLMQLYFIYYGLPKINPILTLPGQWPSALLALSLNSGAYIAEIIRAPIQSIDKGQMEASKALGLTYGQAMKRIIIPQSYRRLIPPVGNELIAIVKDSSLVAIMGMTELMKVTNQISNRESNAAIYLPSAVIYLALTTLFTYVFERLEKKYSVYE